MKTREKESYFYPILCDSVSDIMVKSLFKRVTKQARYSNQGKLHHIPKLSFKPQDSSTMTDSVGDRNGNKVVRKIETTLGPRIRLSLHVGHDSEIEKHEGLKRIGKSRRADISIYFYHPRSASPPSICTNPWP